MQRGLQMERKDGVVVELVLARILQGCCLR